MALYALPTSPMMFFAIGFLIAGMAVLVFFPFDWRDRLHKRAMRADSRRLEATTKSMADILSDRDRLRAEFAVTRHRLDETLEHTKMQAATEIGALNKKIERKDAQLKRLRAELRENNATISELGKRERALRRSRAGKPAGSRSPARARIVAKVAGQRARTQSLH